MVDYAISEATGLANKEQAGFQDFVKEAHGKWRGVAFLSGGLMIATAMLSGLLNMMGLSLMGFSPFTACVNVYAFVFGLFTLILEYKDKADGTFLTVFTGDVKYLIRTQVGPHPSLEPSQPLTATVPFRAPCAVVLSGGAVRPGLLLLLRRHVVDGQGGCHQVSTALLRPRPTPT